MSETTQPEPVEPQEPAVAPAEPVPDTEPVPDDEPDTEPQEPLQEPEPEPSSEAVMEEIGKKLDSLNKYVATKMGTILGEQATDFEVCDLCSYWNTPGWRHKGHLPEDLRDQMAYLIGQRATTELKPDPHSKVCPTCDGEGIVDTKSKVPGQTALSCVECEGMGWLPTDDARRRGRLQVANGPMPPTFGAASPDTAMQPTTFTKSPEQVALEAQGFVVVPPLVTSP